MFNSTDGDIIYPQNRASLGVDNIFGHRFDNRLILQVNTFDPVSGINGRGIECYFNFVTCMEPLAF